MHHQTTLIGFLYSPYRSDPITWCVGRRTEGFVGGEAYPFVFDDILINQGSGWNDKTKKY